MRLKHLLDQSTKRHEAYVETSEKEINSLRNEAVSSKRELTYAMSELTSLKDLIKDLQTENYELKVSSEISRSTIRTHEDRVNLLKTEKVQLESLMSQIQRTLGSSEISKIYNEISRIRGELEIVEREKINLDCQLLKFDSDPRSRDSDNFRELSQKMVQCERQIRNFRKSMQMLQDDANKEEMVQKLRTVDQKSSKSKLGNTSGPQSLNLLRNSDTPTVLRQKSSFS
jgi:chromosome segregation ATPase